MDRNQPINAAQAPSPLEPEDYYFEGPNLVFTAAYHLKRGSCCGSRCRHCPYGQAPTTRTSDASLDDPGRDGSE